MQILELQVKRCLVPKNLSIKGVAQVELARTSSQKRHNLFRIPCGTRPGATEASPLRERLDGS